MNTPTLYPAIDVRRGQVVRLRQGDYAQETCYSDTPLALAAHYAQAGAQWLHLVDLDAARAGGYSQLALLAAIKSTTPLRVQTGGGVRNEADVEALLHAGADRVVIGSLAVSKPHTVLAWLRRFGARRITVAMDARRDAQGGWRLPVAGWTCDSGMQLQDLLASYTAGGLQHLLCTDIDRDGMLAGPNLDLYREIAQRAPLMCVQASGGVRDIADIRAAGAAGCAGVVLGRALLEGCFQLADALRETTSC